MAVHFGIVFGSLSGALQGVSLDFPIRGATGQAIFVPYQASYFSSSGLPVVPLTAVMDHSVTSSQSASGYPTRLPRFYNGGDYGQVSTFTGELGDLSCGDGGSLCPICYKQKIGGVCSPTTQFVVNGNYILSSRSDKTYLRQDGHAGTDYEFPGGTPIFAAADGILSFPTSDPINGNGCPRPCSPRDGFNPLKVDHGYGYETWYLHLQIGSEIISPGQRLFVRRGQKIAELARGDASHLHFEVRKQGAIQDPHGWRGPGADPYWQWASGLAEKVLATNINMWNKPQGSADPLVRWHPDGTVLSDGVNRWLIENNRRRRILNEDIFNAYGFDLHRVIRVNPDELAYYDVDPDLAPPEHHG